MTSSLVGSEMCIRDRVRGVVAGRGTRGLCCAGGLCGWSSWSWQQQPDQNEDARARPGLPTLQRPGRS
eukprot:871030-Prorocentrum_lima.AAC.1